MPRRSPRSRADGAGGGQAATATLSCHRKLDSRETRAGQGRWSAGREPSALASQGRFRKRGGYQAESWRVVRCREAGAGPRPGQPGTPSEAGVQGETGTPAAAAGRPALPRPTEPYHRSLSPETKHRVRHQTTSSAAEEGSASSLQQQIPLPRRSALPHPPAPSRTLHAARTLPLCTRRTLQPRSRLERGRPGAGGWG